MKIVLCLFILSSTLFAQIRTNNGGGGLVERKLPRSDDSGNAFVTFDELAGLAQMNPEEKFKLLYSNLNSATLRCRISFTGHKETSLIEYYTIFALKKSLQSIEEFTLPQSCLSDTCLHTPELTYLMSNIKNDKRSIPYLKTKLNVSEEQLEKMILFFLNDPSETRYEGKKVYPNPNGN